MSLKDITVHFLPGLPGSSMVWLPVWGEATSQFTPSFKLMLLLHFAAAWALSQSFLSVPTDHLLQDQTAASPGVR